MVETGEVIRRSGTFEFLTPVIIIDDVSIEPDLKINKKCLRNINAPMVQNSKGLHICICMSYQGTSGNHCTKFGPYQANGSYNIEWTTLK